MTLVLITGVSRSGTTLACELLNHVPNVVALDEPLSGEALILPKRKVLLGRSGADWRRAERVYEPISAFAAEMRASLLTCGVAVSRHVDGRVTGDKVSAYRAGETRVRLARWGEIKVDKPLDQDFVLAVKDPGMFTSLLPGLAARFRVFALVRNPLATLAAWQTVPFVQRDGHAGAEANDAALARQLERIDDRIDRQIHLLDWWFRRLGDSLPSAHVIRYEDMIASGGRALAVIAQGAAGLDLNLENRNRTPSAPPDVIETLADRLLATDGAYWRLYSRESVGEIEGATRPRHSSLRPGAAAPRRLRWFSRGSRPAGHGVAPRPTVRETVVLFHRHFGGFTGGHMKAWDYFNHVRAMPGFSARIRFTADSVWDETNPWRGSEELLARNGKVKADILFLEGLDWQRVDPKLVVRRPVLNLIQGVRHADPDDVRYAFLDRRALRICVSSEVADAIRATGRVNGPILTIPNGLDLDTLPASHDPEHRRHDVLVLGTKQPTLAAAVAARLRSQGITVDLMERKVPRQVVLERLSDARVAVLVPKPTEGFYLPALEAMALGALVVCPDCIGNRSFCRDGETCLVPAFDEPALAKAALTALAMSPGVAAQLRERARREATEHSLQRERTAFQGILSGLASSMVPCFDQSRA